jgi:hypothetical protein
MDDAMLRADCARCAALCCVAHCFDRSDDFAFDKASGEACPHLTVGFGCAIHANRAAHGMRGCERYDCAGAGQRVVQELFAGRTWRDHPEIAAPMLEAFRILRRVHELLLLLRTAERLPLAEIYRRKSRELRDALSPTDGWTLESLRAFQRSDTPNVVMAFLTSLKDGLSAYAQSACETSESASDSAAKPAKRAGKRRNSRG